MVNEGDGGRVTRLMDLADARAGEQAWATSAILTGILASNRNNSKWPDPFDLTARPAFLDTLIGSSRDEWKRSASRLRRIVTWPGDEHPHPKRPVPKPLTKAQEQRRIAGEAVYNATCFTCHKSDGRGSGRPGAAAGRFGLGQRRPRPPRADRP